MALREPRGDKSDEEYLERLGLKCEEGSIEIATFPFAPFLLTAFEKEGKRRYFVIDKWEGTTIDIDSKGAFTQAFTWEGHKASEEEIKKYLKEETK